MPSHPPRLIVFSGAGLSAESAKLGNGNGHVKGHSSGDLHDDSFFDM
jgi:hypothetical protein